MVRSLAVFAYNYRMLLNQCQKLLICFHFTSGGCFTQMTSKSTFFGFNLISNVIKGKQQNGVGVGSQYFFSSALDKEHSKKKTIQIFLSTLFPDSQNTFSLSLFCGRFCSFLVGFSSSAPSYTLRATILSSFCELSNSLLPYLRLAIQFEKSFRIVFSYQVANIRNLENF